MVMKREVENQYGSVIHVTAVIGFVCIYLQPYSVLHMSIFRLICIINTQICNFIFRIYNYKTWICKYNDYN